MAFQPLSLWVVAQVHLPLSEFHSIWLKKPTYWPHVVQASPEHFLLLEMEVSMGRFPLCRMVLWWWLPICLPGRLWLCSVLFFQNRASLWKTTPGKNIFLLFFFSIPHHPQWKGFILMQDRLFIFLFLSTCPFSHVKKGFPFFGKVCMQGLEQNRWCQSLRAFWMIVLCL